MATSTNEKKDAATNGINKKSRRIVRVQKKSCVGFECGSDSVNTMVNDVNVILPTRIPVVKWSMHR